MLANFVPVLANEGPFSFCIIQPALTPPEFMQIDTFDSFPALQGSSCLLICYNLISLTVRSRTSWLTVFLCLFVYMFHPGTFVERYGCLILSYICVWNMSRKQIFSTVLFVFNPTFEKKNKTIHRTLFSKIACQLFPHPMKSVQLRWIWSVYVPSWVFQRPGLVLKLAYGKLSCL